jgi:flagellar motor switch protein FliM
MHILTFPTRIKNKHCFFFFLLPFLKIERTREREEREEREREEREKRRELLAFSAW